MMAVGALLIQLTMIIIIAIVSKFHLKKVQGMIQICYFVLVIATISTAAFTFAK